MNVNKNFHCRSLRLAGYLMTRGFVLLNMYPDTESKRNIYVFKNSEELYKAVQDYTRK